MPLIDIIRTRARRSPLVDHAAFTLVELLTVIAIIGILAGILIPVVNSVRKNARVAQVTSNLRELTKATMLYAADNKNIYPKINDNTKPPGWSALSSTAGQTWAEVIWAYQYPNRAFSWDTYYNNDTFFHTPFLDTSVASPRSFAMNQSLDQENRRYGMLPSPARTVIFGDGSGKSSAMSANTILAPRTNGKIAFAWLDGHVTLLTSADVPTSTNDIFWRGIMPAGQ
ncbi:MAG: prepilin-type N-terminal cleavage/methylation domain-containing protein [Verrucomicrobiota bacterium]